MILKSKVFQDSGNFPQTCTDLLMAHMAEHTVPVRTQHTVRELWAFAQVKHAQSPSQFIVQWFKTTFEMVALSKWGNDPQLCRQTLGGKMVCRRQGLPLHCQLPLLPAHIA